VSQHHTRYALPMAYSPAGSSPRSFQWLFDGHLGILSVEDLLQFFNKLYALLTVFQVSNRQFSRLMGFNFIYTMLMDLVTLSVVASDVFCV
jgi:hypothetical protein